MSDLTQRPFANLRTDMLADQRAAIAAMHRAAQQQQHNERALFGVVFDVEGRAHDTRTGKYRARPASTRHLSRAFPGTEG